MGLGDLVGKAKSLLGGAGGAADFDMGAKMEELGVDASMLEGLDLEAAKTLLAEKGLDLSMLEGLGLNVEDLLAKFTGDA